MRAELHDFISADEGAVLSGYRSEGLAEAVEVVQQLTGVPRVSARYLLQGRDGRRLAGNLAPMPARAGTFQIHGSEGHVVLGEGGYLPDGTYLFVGETTDRLAGGACPHPRIVRVDSWGDDSAGRDGRRGAQ